MIELICKKCDKIHKVTINYYRDNKYVIANSMWEWYTLCIECFKKSEFPTYTKLNAYVRFIKNKYGYNKKVREYIDTLIKRSIAEAL